MRKTQAREPFGVIHGWQWNYSISTRITGERLLGQLGLEGNRSCREERWFSRIRCRSVFVHTCWRPGRLSSGSQQILSSMLSSGWKCGFAPRLRRPRKRESFSLEPSGLQLSCCLFLTLWVLHLWADWFSTSRTVAFTFPFSSIAFAFLRIATLVASTDRWDQSAATSSRQEDTLRFRSESFCHFGLATARKVTQCSMRSCGLLGAAWRAT